jgi:hypothetical protein
MLTIKGLWVEDLDGPAEQGRVLQHIQDTGANLVCVRTTSPLLPALIPIFHAQNVKVYGWMWASVVPHQPQHRYARDEANHVATNLVPAGLDGYIFDIESDDGNPPTKHDWDRTDVEDLNLLAQYYTSTIKNAFVARGTSYLLGLTSHARGFSNYPGIPWQPFLSASSILYPQTYWRYNDGTPQHMNCLDENADPTDPHHLRGKGTPAQALANGFNDYSPKGKPIVPVAGEIGCAKAGEMIAFGALVAARGLTEAHFYVDVDDNTLANPAVFQEIKAL